MASERAAQPGNTLLLLLLLRLVDAGSLALEHDQQRDIKAHRTAVTASSGKYADTFGRDFLAALREDWPA